MATADPWLFCALLFRFCTAYPKASAAIEDVDLLLVAASAFGEARKVMNATDNDLKDI